MAHRATVNQQVQLGVEATAGTSVPADKLLTAFDWTFGGKPTTKQFTGTGRKYPSASALLMELSQGGVSGPGDFDQLPYIVAGCYGKITPAAHAPSITAFDWIWTPPISGPGTIQSYTVQNGDANDAEQYTFLHFPDWGYSFTRQQEIQISGTWAARTFTDGQALTASPTAQPLQPMTGAMANVYLDPTSGAIGTTQLTNPMAVSFAASGFWRPFWPIDRSKTSFADVIDDMPKNELKLKLEADTAGIAIRGSYLEVGARCYVRVDVQGALADVANSVHYQMTHDMACFVVDMSELADTDGVYGVEYTLEVAEDAAWATGQSQKLTMTNLLASL